MLKIQSEVEMATIMMGTPFVLNFQGVVVQKVEEEVSEAREAMEEGVVLLLKGRSTESLSQVFFLFFQKILVSSDSKCQSYVCDWPPVCNPLMCIYKKN